MATKKQKREAALAKRAEFMEKVKADGLEALSRDRRNQAVKRQAAIAEAVQLNERYQAILDRA